jgi:hypothetical protein
MSDQDFVFTLRNVSLVQPSYEQIQVAQPLKAKRSTKGAKPLKYVGTQIRVDKKGDYIMPIIDDSIVNMKDLTGKNYGSDKPFNTMNLMPGRVRIQGDDYGNVLFPKAVGVSEEKFQSGLDKCLAAAKLLLEKAGDIAADYRVETITLKLAVDAQVGLVFVGDAKVETGIEVEIKRIEKK